MSRLPLAGRVVLITGAARGIGAELARQAAARGARLSLVGLEPDLLAALTAHLGPEHVSFEADVSDQAALDRAVSGTVEALGGIDVVVANAGVAPYGTVAMTPVDVLARTVEVNLVGAIRTVSAALPCVVARRGHVLVISSAAAFTVLPSMAAYGASKAGVEHFANALRLEVAHAGVSVASAHPGWIDTDLVSDLEEDLGGFGSEIRRLPGPLGAVTSVEDCARVLLDGIESRRARVYVPRALALVQALRPLILGPLGRLVLQRAVRGSVPGLEREIGALGRFFGRRSVEGDGTALAEGRVQLREATAEDAGFLLEMLVEACNWTGEERVGRRDVAADPHLKHYVTGWPRERDFGVIAVEADGTPVGAAWARAFTAQAPGYGFVAADVPEVSIALAASQRGRGIGRRLLEAVVDAARQQGWHALSLSVEDGNRAARLYEAAGFRKVGRNGTSDTMVLDLRG